jgi:hypothetical protein
MCQAIQIFFSFICFVMLRQYNIFSYECRGLRNIALHFKDFVLYVQTHLVRFRSVTFCFRFSFHLQLLILYLYAENQTLSLFCPCLSNPLIFALHGFIVCMLQII